MIQKCTLGILVPVYLINSVCTIIIPVWIGILVIIIAWGQKFMTVNQPESEGVARGQGWFTSP